MYVGDGMRFRGESGATAGVAKIHTLPDMEKGIADTEFSEKAPDKLKPDPEALTKLKKKRAGVLKELYHTEKQYVEDMETITNVRCWFDFMLKCATHRH